MSIRHSRACKVYIVEEQIQEGCSDLSLFYHLCILPPPFIGSLGNFQAHYYSKPSSYLGLESSSGTVPWTHYYHYQKLLACN